ncbi:MAG TPA: alkene reductase [Cyclobacteriaceae bacterium]
MKKLLSPFSKGKLQLKNHLVMAPMTRSRAINNVPNELMQEYYAQRIGAGLIITEGTAPSPEALGYPRIPGIYTEEQTVRWKEVTDAVHKGGSKIFLQLMHTGRIGHQDNLPEGHSLAGVSAIKAEGQIYTDANGMQDHSQPATLSTEGVYKMIEAHVQAARNAMKAGFDGIELHGANGYLIEQFLNPNVNDRVDEFGGSVQARSRIVIELAKRISEAIGAEKVGVRFSPYSTLGDLKSYAQEEVHKTYAYLADQLNEIGITYIHIGVSAEIPVETLKEIRSAFKGTINLCNGLTPETAETELQHGFADLVAFGRSFLANPDLDKRIASGAPLNQPDYTSLYLPGPKGYTDYPFMNEQPVTVI